MQSTHRVRKLAVLLLGALSTCCFGAAAPPPAPVAPFATAPSQVTAPKPTVSKTIKQNIEARFPGITVSDVQPSPIPGLYEVLTGDERIVYADETADYVLMGPLLDTQTRKNLTEARMNARATINFHSLPFDRAVKVVKGNGSRQFAVFSDPDCPFCQQLEKSLLPVTNYTMYVFLFPIATLHPQATAKAHAIWCAKDRSQAWTDWMHDKKLPAAGTSACSGDPIEELQKFGDKIHINSTPTLFFADGQRVAGAIPTSELEQSLTASNAAKPAATTAH
jgi:thiol:disulfide interchange protein DsbC